MDPNPFTDRSAPPRPEEVAATLGGAAARWDDLKRRMAATVASLTEEWGFTPGRNNGWGLRLKRGDRIIAYLAPRADHFLIGFVLGEKAVRAAQADGLPEPVLTLIDGSRKYAEGRGVRFEVRSDDDVQAAVELAAIKAAN